MTDIPEKPHTTAALPAGLPDGRSPVRRENPAVPAGGHHHFPAGHCERAGAVARTVREAREEAGLTEVREPDKGVEWVWADQARLSEPIGGYARTAIGHGAPYSELGRPA